MHASAAQALLAFFGLMIIAIGFCWYPDQYDQARESYRERNKKNLHICQAFWLFGGVCVAPAFFTLWNHAIFG